VVGEAGDGISAISEYTADADIVLMDITMPQMEASSGRKDVRNHPSARIVIVSSVVTRRTSCCPARGARHFVQKPVKPRFSMKSSVRDAR